MINYDDTAHQVTVKKNAVDRFHRFNYTQHNFNVALSIVSKSWIQSDIVLDEYVSFSAVEVEWWWDFELQEFNRNITKVPLRKCRETDKSKFRGYEESSGDWLDA